MLFLERKHLTATLRLGVVWSHFLVAGAEGLLVFYYAGLVFKPWLVVGALLAGGLVLMAFEFALEGLLLRRVEEWAIRLTPLASLLDFIFRPFSWLLMVMLGSPPYLKQAGGISDDELRNWVEAGQSEGSLEAGERKMIYSIFQFSDTLCREIMVPRMDVSALDVETPLNEAMQVFTRLGHSRLPVYEESIDNIIGILYAKDLLRVKFAPKSEAPPIRSLVRPAYFVPEAKKVDELLEEMQSRRVHMAIVVDEYGGVAGLVTLEDIVEEIVGEIHDEYDQGEELVVQASGEDEFLIQGRIDLDDLNEVLGTTLTKEVADTLAGYIYGAIGRVPTGGEEVTVDGWILRVEKVSGRRISTVRAIPHQRKDADDDKEKVNG